MIAFPLNGTRQCRWGTELRRASWREATRLRRKQEGNFLCNVRCQWGYVRESRKDAECVVQSCQRRRRTSVDFSQSVLLECWVCHVKECWYSVAWSPVLGVCRFTWPAVRLIWPAAREPDLPSSSPDLPSGSSDLPSSSSDLPYGSPDLPSGSPDLPSGTPGQYYWACGNKACPSVYRALLRQPGAGVTTPPWMKSFLSEDKGGGNESIGKISRFLRISLVILKILAT